MNKYTYIILMGLIAIVLWILTNYISEYFMGLNWMLFQIQYVLLTGLIGILLHRKVKQ